jgi:small-conductance mechanosensitive channel
MGARMPTGENPAPNGPQGSLAPAIGANAFGVHGDAGGVRVARTAGGLRVVAPSLVCARACLFMRRCRRASDRIASTPVPRIAVTHHEEEISCMQPPLFITWVQDTTFAGVPLWSLLVALTAAAVTYAAISAALHLLTGRAKGWATRSGSAAATTMVDVLEGTSRLLMLLVAVLVGLGFLELPRRWESRVAQLWFVAVALQMGLWGMRAIGIGVQRYVTRHSSSGMTQVSASATLLSWGLRTLLWSVVALAVLSNLGVNITAFVASLGVGGIAVALAVQSILADLFASLSIAVDKPFEVGDFVVVGGVSGTVQMIGLKTTRIRSLQGEEVVMSNTDILKLTLPPKSGVLSPC